MTKKKCKGLLVSDFNIQNLAGYLKGENDSLIIDVEVAPYDQVIQTLMQYNNSTENKKDMIIVWTQPESIITSFKEIIEFEKASLKKIIKEVDDYSSILIEASKKTKTMFVPLWIVPSYNRGHGMIDIKNEFGISNVLRHMNMRLIENLKNNSNIFILDSQRWISLVGKQAFSSKLYYMGKIPFNNDVFKEASKDIKSALDGINGFARKLIVVDLDDTLWGGIVGDVGWENLKLGGHDPHGESFVDFQNALKSFSKRGIILGIVSKNEENIAIEAIKKHPEMVLKLDDFAGWKINWQDKAKNIMELTSELNLGLQSVVFIDDNPVERARVREALPDVFVPEWPEDKMLYKSFLLNLRCFDAPLLSEEDVKRTKMYVAERKRENMKESFISIDKWLKSIDMRISVNELSKENIQRTTQLINKTNQMNLTTRRMTESELSDWVKQENNKLLTFSVSDKFGDSGLTGIISIEIEKDVGKIVDFVLSCRVLGRKVEETMLHQLIKYAKDMGLKEIKAKYIPTEKNKPCLGFWKKSGFDYNEKKNTFKWKIDKDFPLPNCIKIV
ncbi:FkbH-like protein [Candidatus Woesearchaeota archaeon B3_Woes]|nr:MAG: FkbH-like protein [Candidatus Woesearchaeota archaeon B3_Woes]